MKAPISEHFHSIQGEGYWVGTPMHFIRLAGCTVGQLVGHKGVPESGVIAPTLPTGRPAWMCHRWDGTPFWCDTDFHVVEHVDLDDLLNSTWEHHICLTGGEPLMHMEVVVELAYKCRALDKHLHVETSGTINPPTYIPWLTVSPKIGWLPGVVAEADELKLLVDKTTVTADFPQEFLNHPRVYLSPVNRVDQSNLDSLNYTDSLQALERSMELLKLHPTWKLSVQLHKYLGVR